MRRLPDGEVEIWNSAEGENAPRWTLIAAEWRAILSGLFGDASASAVVSVTAQNGMRYLQFARHPELIITLTDEEMSRLQ